MLARSNLTQLGESGVGGRGRRGGIWKVVNLDIDLPSRRLGPAPKLTRFAGCPPSDATRQTTEGGASLSDHGDVHTLNTRNTVHLAGSGRLCPVDAFCDVLRIGSFPWCQHACKVHKAFGLMRICNYSGLILIHWLNSNAMGHVVTKRTCEQSTPCGKQQ